MNIKKIKLFINIGLLLGGSIFLCSGCSSLERSLISGDDNIRQSALDKLTILEPYQKAKLVNPLLQDLDSSYWEVRARAAEALGSITDKKVLEALVKALKDDDKEVRVKAAQSLGKLRDPNSIAPLIEATNDKEYDVRKSAVIALGIIGTCASGDEEVLDALIKILKDVNNDLKIDALWSIVCFGEKAIEPLFGLLKDENFYIRWTVEAGLVNIGATAAKYLDEVFPNQEWFVKWRIVKMLGLIKGKESNKALEYSLGSNEDVKFKATEALGLKNNPDMVQPLLKYLKDKDPNIRMRVIEYLGFSENKNVIKDILPFIKDGDKNIKEEALASIDLLGYKPDTLEDKITYFVSKKKWPELNGLGTKTVKKLIEMLYNTTNDDIKAMFIEALGEMKYRAVFRPVLSNARSVNPKVRLAVLEALTKIQDVDIIDEVISALHDEDEGVVIKAIQILAKKKDQRAIKSLVKILASESVRVRDELITALVSFGKPAINAVISRLRDNNSARDAAIKILENMTFIEAKAGLDNYWHQKQVKLKIEKEKSRKKPKVNKKDESEDKQGSAVTNGQKDDNNKVQENQTQKSNEDEKKTDAKKGGENNK